MPLRVFNEHAAPIILVLDAAACFLLLTVPQARKEFCLLFGKHFFVLLFPAAVDAVGVRYLLFQPSLPRSR